MDDREPAGCGAEAQRFCAENYTWLVFTSERVLRKRGYSGRGNDLAHDVRNKCAAITNEKWCEVKNHKAYLARIIINEAKDFCRENAPLVELTPLVLPSSSVEALEASILIAEARGNFLKKKGLYSTLCF